MLRVLVSVGSEGFRSLDNFSENICYMSRGRGVLQWAGGSTSIDSLGGIREKTAFLVEMFLPGFWNALKTFAKLE